MKPSNLLSLMLLIPFISACGPDSEPVYSPAVMDAEEQLSTEATTLASLPDGKLAAEALFLACAGCHSLTQGATHKVGPNLFGLVGKPAGTQPDYSYSPALVKAGESGLVWQQGTLNAWILMTEGMVPGTWMLYHNYLKPDEIQELVEYILAQRPADSG